MNVIQLLISACVHTKNAGGNTASPQMALYFPAFYSANSPCTLYFTVKTLRFPGYLIFFYRNTYRSFGFLLLGYN